MKQATIFQLLKFAVFIHLLLLVDCTPSEPSTVRIQTDTVEATPFKKFYKTFPDKISPISTSGKSDSHLGQNQEVPPFVPTTLYAIKKKQKKVYSKHTWQRLITIGKTKVWINQVKTTTWFKSGMSIDADGSPKAYHPKNIGLDDLKHAGNKGNWWALATKNGKPVVQKNGYYVSTTSLQDLRYTPWDQRRYVNAEKIPYIVLPPKLKRVAKINLGDIAIVYNTYNQRWTYAIYADTGADSRIGEGSIALAKLLGINANARNGGIQQGIVYLVFPGSGLGKPLTIRTIRKTGAFLLDKFGGLTNLVLLTKK